MKALSPCVLALAVLCGMVPTVCAIDNSQGKWALHFAGTHDVKGNTCSFDIGDCQNIVTEGPAGPGRFDVYVIGCDVERIQSTRFGLRCDGAFYFYGWTNCADLEAPTPSWPICDEGNQLSWTAGQEGPYVNLGILDIYAYGGGRLWTRSDPRVGFAEWCDDSEPSPSCFTTTDPQAFGYVEFGTLGTISGTKFNDINGNGIRDGGEAGLPGWVITLDPGALSTSTDENGQYSFTGLEPNTYTIGEVLQSNWVQTYPAVPGTHVVDVGLGEQVTGIDFGNRYQGSISGTKFNDANENGIRDGGEAGLAGWTITLDPGAFSTLTNESGGYSFSLPGPDTYTVSEVLKSNWEQTYPPVPGSHVVDVSLGEEVTGVDFGNTYYPVDNSQGKWALHFAGTHDVKLNTCSFDIGDCQNIVTEGPAGPGHFDVYVIACDVERIQSTRFGLRCEGDPSPWPGGSPYPFYYYGWTRCSDVEIPSSGWPGCDEGNQLGWSMGQDGPYVTLGILDIYVYGHSRLRTRHDPRVGYAEWIDDSPDTVSFKTTDPAAFGYVEFGIPGPLQGSISGTKFNDANGNGIRDGGEAGLAGWLIQLNPGARDALTDENGQYCFSDLEPNTYTISEILKPNWIQTYPTVPGTHVVDVSLGEEVTGIDFGNSCRGSISGTKFNDANGNGIRDGGEVGLAGWMIQLNPGWRDTLSDENGRYCFSGLEPNTYTISEVLKHNWVQTFPTVPGTHVVALSSGEEVTGIDFGNSSPHCSVDCGTWYIEVDGTGDAPTIQAGIDSAAAGDTVLVAAGTYTGAGNKELDFGGKVIVLRSEAGPEVTIIDCEGTGYGFHFHSGESVAAVVEGFTITNGVGSTEAPPYYGDPAGGAVLCVRSSPTLTNCILSGNSAWIGGGVYCHLSSPTVTNCTFSQNSGNYFGGGGMYCGYLASPTLVGCTFSQNSAGYGGGIYCEGVASPTVTNCIFAGNSASGSGGGMYSESSTPTLTGCTFSGNSAQGVGDMYYGGGGLFCAWGYGWSPTLTNCTFSGNSANHGGGIYCVIWSSPRLVNCTFSGNSASDGGSVSCYDTSSPTLQNTIIALSTQGVAVHCDWQSNPVLTCCDLYGNAGGDWAGCVADQYGFNGNICADPLFCDPENGNFNIADASPCAPDNSPSGCGLIGAWPVGCGPDISGVKFNDADGSGTRDAGEEGLRGWMITLSPGGLATLTDENGEYHFAGLDHIAYTVGEVIRPDWEQTFPLSGTHVVDLSSGQPVTDIDFGNRALSDIQDLSVSVAGGRARPGFQKRYGITYQNKGTVAVDATVTLDLPSAVNHLESSSGGTYSPGKHKVTWNVGTLPPGFIDWLWTKVQIPVTVPLDSVLTSTALIKPSGGDKTPIDNEATESQVVTGSFDPNDKQVTPEGFILCSDTLTYQVNFQNVGTDTAFNIVVRDTLDMNLDITTLVNGASLHPNVFQIAGRELSWTFNNIQLPDSNVNEPGSHGFVTFKVRPMPDLPVGTEIENHAGVYFDFNPPVITNTVLNTIIEALPATVDVDPNTLNLKSEGKYATTYIELPQGCDPSDIDVSTVLFNGVLPAVAAPTAVADYDSDGVADRMVKFNRSGIIGLLSGSEGSRWWLEERGGETAPLRHGEEFEITVSGELEDGTPFLGTDVIRVINPGGGSDEALILEVYPSPLDKVATISFELPVKGPVKLCIYDAAGRLVRRLLEGEGAAGRHDVTWDCRTDAGRQVSAGVYFVRLEKQGGAVVEKVLVVR